ncbi:DUF2207 domain-containing protein [Bacillus sp. FJAT-50079]|uniref:DUF2207 domain-containing protein n=1 Tax=Bacillus sp. FJAT-50079 TaxID=2833577 RepID=UPI001BC90414|nr:DUF2207 domain-containing protein [Bacillus sp. FJAT-50079]MBS4210417.1 DUF2207 domain-containing protein [Bacillus sp. FJAT-50079]
MKNKKIILALIIVIGLLLPSNVLAVEFTIPEVQINAYLLPNGDVDVHEQHTYVFTGAFNGLIREIAPKTDAKVSNFSVTENGKKLRFEKNEDEYKIFRPGQDETVTIDIQYEIINGVEKYEDGGQFYWSFFDDRNTSDYGNMTIHLIPPQASSDSVSIGYGVLRGKDSITADGEVHYDIGSVKAGKSGAVRAVFPVELFPDASLTKGKIYEEVAMFEEDRSEMQMFGKIMITAVGIFFILLFISTVTSPRRKRKKAKEIVSQQQSMIPKEKVSIPALVHLKIGTGSLEAAALLDLMRKGIVKHVSQDKFQLVDHPNVEHAHEQAFIDLFFHKVGNGTEFRMEDLEAYTKDTNNHGSYQSALRKWKRGIEKELKDKKIKKNRAFFRLFLACLSIIVFLFALSFVNYELFALATYSFILSPLFLLFAIFYQPMSLAEYLLRIEWRQFSEAIRNRESKEWETLNPNDKLRALAYGVGVGDRQIEKQFSAFADAELRTTPVPPDRTDHHYPLYGGVLATFDEAKTTTSPPSSSGDTSTSSYSGGGGVGGSGGGSGAF